MASSEDQSVKCSDSVLDFKRHFDDGLSSSSGLATSLCTFIVLGQGFPRDFDHVGGCSAELTT